MFSVRMKVKRFNSLLFPLHVQWAWPHLEFESIECVFGGAAERTLDVHSQRVEQLLALGLQGAADLQAGGLHRAGAVVDQLGGGETRR